MERILSELVEKIGKAHGGNVVSVVLYGSGAATEAKDSYSDYNVLCVLRDLTPEQLRVSEPIFRWWREMGNPSPLLLSLAEVQTGTDCFAMEFHDIRERHRILAGSDVVAGIEIDDIYYRAQVERELRVKLLRLRQKAAGVLSEPDLLLRLMAESVSTFCVLFRHALILAGEAPMFGKREVVGAAAARFDMDAKPFHALLDLREQKTKERDLHSVSLFANYLQEIHAVVEAVNRMQR